MSLISPYVKWPELYIVMEIYKKLQLITYRNKEKVNTSKINFFFFIQDSVFWPAKSQSDVYFCQTEK